MTASQGELASLSRFIFRAPNWYSSLLSALLVAAVVGVGAFDSRYVLEDAWQGIFFIGIPTVVASFATAAVDRGLGGQLTPNRSSLLALACEFVIVAFIAVAAVVAYLTALEQSFVFDALIVGLASIFAFRLLILMAVSGHRLLVAAVPAAIQTGMAAVLLFVYSGTMLYYEIGGPILRAYLSRPEKAPPELTVIAPDDFVLLIVLSVIYAGFVYGFLAVIDRPWRRSLGVSVLDFLAGFIGHIAEDTDELETFFEQLGETAVVPVTVFSVNTTTGVEKARFVLPMIHPGPMGQIGGGNLPVRVAERSEGLAFPPHATAGHDFNLVTKREVDTILDAAERAHDRIEYHDSASPSVRTTEGDASVLGQAFGDDLFLVGTYAPGFADDVEYGVGLTAAAEARGAGFEVAMLIDAHNSNDGLKGEDLGHIVPGSQRSFQMIRAAKHVGRGLADADQGAFRLGVAWDPTAWMPSDGIGPLGVRVAVFDVDGAGTTAYVLIDGNNMEPGLRDHILDAVNGVDALEVMTTDTHVVNTVDSVNQVGGAIDHDELVAVIQQLVDDALADREPVTGGMATEFVEVTVFGNDRTETLASHANALISMGGALAGAVLVAALAISVLLFFFA